MLPRGRGNIFFTGATASRRGGIGYAAFASAKFGLRAVAESAARELGPQNIHVAHLIIDAGVDTAWVRDRIRQREGEAAVAELAPARLMRPQSVAEAYWQLYREPATPGRSSARSGPSARNGETMTAMPKVEFHFDFGSPNAYLAHRVIPEIEHRTGVKFDYVPVLLGGVFKLTGNRSPAEAFAGIRNKLEYERRETERFVARHHIADFRRNPFFPVNTLTIMRGAVAAARLGVFEHYVDEMYRRMWSEMGKLDDPAVWQAALHQSGFDAARFAALVQDADVKAELIANTENSVARGTFGSPTFFVGNEIFFGKDRLRDVVEAILAP